MGILSGVLERILPLEGPYPLTAARLVEALGGPASATGKQVNLQSALGITAVSSCVRVLADGVASLPLPLYERLPRGKQRAPRHPVYQLLHDQPNPWMTPYTFKETLTGHVLLRGNAYAGIERDREGYPVALWPLRPDNMVDIRQAASGQLLYLYRLPSGETTRLRQDEVLHLRGLSPDGVRGYAPLTLYREALGLTLAEEEFGARFFKNSAVPRGVLQTKGHLTPQAMDNLRVSWNTAHQGLSEAHRVAILEEGIEWKAIGLPMEDAAWITGRTFQLLEICRIFRVPPHKIYELTRATYSNIEKMALEFLGDSLEPWLVRWEEQINISLLSPVDRQRYFAEFLMDAALRSDVKTRYEAYGRGRQWGWLSANDIREKENMNPVDGLDSYLQPVNMISVGDEADAEPPEPSDQEDEPRTVVREVQRDQEGRIVGVIERIAPQSQRARFETLVAVGAPDLPEGNGNGEHA